MSSSGFLAMSKAALAHPLFWNVRAMRWLLLKRSKQNKVRGFFHWTQYSSNSCMWWLAANHSVSGIPVAASCDHHGHHQRHDPHRKAKSATQSASPWNHSAVYLLYGENFDPNCQHCTGDMVFSFWYGDPKLAGGGLPKCNLHFGRSPLIFPTLEYRQWPP